MVSLLLAVGCARFEDWQHQRALREARAENDAALAYVTLPRVEGPGVPGSAALRVSVDRRGVSVDDTAWALARTPEERATLLPGRELLYRPALAPLPAPQPVEVSRPVLDELEELATLRRRLESASDAFAADDRFAVYADAELPFGVVAGVLYTAGQAGWSTAELAVSGSQGPAVVVHEGPRICGHGADGPPCVLVTLIAETSGWQVIGLPAQDSDCGVAMPARPDAALPALRSETFALSETEAMGVWVSEAGGGEPICGAAILSGGPEVPWGAVVTGLEVLGRSGVRRPQLGVRP